MKKNFKKILGVVLAASMAISTSAYADEGADISSDSSETVEAPAEDSADSTEAPAEDSQPSDTPEDSSEDSADTDEAENSSEETISGEEVSDDTDNSSSSEIIENEYISEDDALYIAIGDASLDISDIVIEKAEFKDKDGNPAYEFKITSDNAKYTYVINALDGSISYKDIYYIGGNTADITQDAALDIAVNDAGIDISAAVVETFTLNKGSNVFGYKFLINVDNVIHEYIISASNGSIIKKNTYRKDNGKNDISEVTTEYITESTTEETTENITEDNTEISTVIDREKPDKNNKDKDNKDNNKEVDEKEPVIDDNDNEENVEYLSETAVLDIVASDAAIDISTAEIEKIKLDEKDDVLCYEVKIKTDSAKYEYLINAIDGTIIDKEIDEKEHDNDDKDDKKENTEYLPETDILDIVASDAAIDISTASIKKIKLDNEDNTPCYTAKIYIGKTKYSYLINAVDGTIINSESNKRTVDVNYEQGDVDCDGEITVGDIDVVLEKILDSNYQSIIEQENGDDFVDIMDLDDDGKITTLDAELIFEKSLKKL